MNSDHALIKQNFEIESSHKTDGAWSSRVYFGMSMFVGLCHSLFVVAVAIIIIITGIFKVA